MLRRISAIPVFTLLCAAALHVPSVWGQIINTRPVAGLREDASGTHAITAAKVFMTADRVLEPATVLIRDGVVMAVGKDLEIPPGARRWDHGEATIYPGFFDAFTKVTGLPEPKGAKHWNKLIRPQQRLSDHWEPKDQKPYRDQGITCRYFAPFGGIINGWGLVASTGNETANDRVLLEQAALHLRLTVPPRGGRDNFPASPMGAVALARQTFYDAGWYHRAWSAFGSQPRVPKPEVNTALAALHSAVAEQGLTIMDAPDEQYLFRADDFAHEFGIRIAIRGSGNEYRRLEAVRDTGRTIIVPLNFPAPPKVDTPELAAQATLERLLDWDLAPENPGRLAAADIPIVFTTEGLKKPADFWKSLRSAVKRGLDPKLALRALTIDPARLFGVQDRLGSLETGKQAHLVITNGDVFDKQTKILETWVDGRRYPAAAEKKIELTGTWHITLAASGSRPRELWLELQDKSAKVTGSIRTTAEKPATKPSVDEQPTGESDATDTAERTAKLEQPSTDTDAEEPTAKTEARLKSVQRVRSRLETSFDSQAIGQHEGRARISLVVISAEGKETTPRLYGKLAWPDGAIDSFRAASVPATEDAPDPQSENKNNVAEQTASKAAPPRSEPDSSSEKSEKASFAVNYPLGAYGREAPPESFECVAFTGGTIWTCTDAGVITEGTVLVERGEITVVGRDVTIPDGAQVIDIRGKHLTPGIIDCHSHMATDGGINEATQAITAEVRIGDFIDSTDITIYRQLAGGVTTANILHGSANPIGGQNQVIKLRWGALPADMKFADAPAGIKFALGENVKQSNWGDKYRTRYPQTRMGVEQIIRDAFHAAEAYQQRWNQWNKTHTGMPPRRDLELEALSEILERTRWIHCHSYRQDEILALLRTLEDFDVTIGTLQHILEGYKVAEVMASHGAMGSSFADWWAYKFEVYDAIPFNGALMHQQGVVVSFNSDDAELGRHLNHEAAKAVKYGQVAPQEALKFVTLNPARQLRIDNQVGSIEAEKDADLVVWSGPPLSTMSICEQTWIDGRRYFDRQEDRSLREQTGRMRTTLIQKILDSGQKPIDPKMEIPPLREQYPRHNPFCPHHVHR